MTATTTVADPTPETATPSPLRSLMNVWAIAVQHKSLVALGIAVALALGGLAYFQTPPVFQSYAQVLVVRKRPDIPIQTTDSMRGGMSGSYAYEDYLPTHVILIQSAEVLERAATKIDPRTLNVPPVDMDVQSVLRPGLSVSREKEKDSIQGPTNILRISMRSSSPTDCKRLVEAVIEGYSGFLSDTYKSMNDDTLKIIREYRNIMEKDLVLRREEYDKLIRENFDNSLALQSKDGLRLTIERLGQLQRRNQEIKMRQSEIDGRLKLIAKAKEEKRDSAYILGALQNLESSRSSGAQMAFVSLETMLLELVSKRHAEVINKGANHPDVASLDRRIEIYSSYLRQYGRGKDNDKIDPLEAQIELMKVEQMANDLILSEQEPMLLAEKKAADRLANFMTLEEAAKKKVEEIEKVRDLVAQKWQTIDFTKNDDGFKAQVITSPIAGAKVAPSLVMYAILSTLAGVGLGFGLAYLADFTDKSFRSPQEIQQRLGLTVIGHIPYIPESKTGDAASHEHVAPALVAFHAPKSPEAEAFRGVRTSLYFSTQGRGHQVVQVTSPGMGDGKSTLIANLAISIAQTGRKTVLIDADFRRPRVHKLFPSISREVGMASVMSGDATLEQAIRPTIIPNLSLLPCGPRPANPAELLTAPRFQELLGEIRNRFDFVLIDTPPVLLVSDPCVVAPRVDGVILVIRLNKNNRPTAERAAEVLSGLGANMLGIMVNDSDSGSQYGYGYNKYGYGYKYRYRYGYGYRYNYRYSYQYGYGYQPAYGDSADDEDGNVNGAANGHSRTTSPLPAAEEPAHPPEDGNGFIVNINGEPPPPKG
jgi:capsular exopolysaccharide synthesis family protein